MSFDPFRSYLEPTEDPTENRRPNVAYHHASYAFWIPVYVPLSKEGVEVARPSTPPFHIFPLTTSLDPTLSTGSTGLNEFLHPDHYNSQPLSQVCDQVEDLGNTSLSLQAEDSTAWTTHTWPLGTNGITNTTTTQDTYISTNWGSPEEGFNVSIPTDGYAAAFNLAVGPGLDFYSNTAAIVPTPYMDLNSGLTWNQNTFFPPPTEARTELLQPENFALPGHPRRAMPAAPPRQAEQGNQQRAKHVCAVCQRSFSRNADLQRHMGKHGRTRNIKCTYPGCGAAFYRRDKLYAHERSGVHAKLARTN